MRIRSMAVLAVCVAASTVLAGCGPKAQTAPPPLSGPLTGAAPAHTSSAAALPVKDLTPGNCTLYTKASAVTLLGAVNDNNKALDIGTDGGTKIDACSYIDFKGGTAVEGISYAVVRYDNASTAQTEVQKLQTEMLGDAADHSWPVQTLTTPAPGAGPVLGGTGTKTEQGVTFTIAVVGTNVGPYLVAALGASSLSKANGEKYALAVFQALNAAVG